MIVLFYFLQGDCVSPLLISLWRMMMDLSLQILLSLEGLLECTDRLDMLLFILLFRYFVYFIMFRLE